MDKSKFYAIKKGKNVSNKIVTSWEECKKYVEGYNSIYKAFSSYEEAMYFLSDNKVVKIYDENNKELNIVKYNSNNGTYNIDFTNIEKGTNLILKDEMKKIYLNF
ncbi:MAG: RNase H1/viroplasmin domain-containing protein [Cetobacterium sp.]|nr:RNase H1/viroplasmin domain-containing protein [Cetobacterium sp.]